MLLASILVALAACAPVPSAPFGAFADATKSLETSGDKLVEQLAVPAKDRIRARLTDGTLAPSAIVLTQSKVDPVAGVLRAETAADAPYQLRLPAFRAGLLSFNRAISGYAGGLVRLSDPGLVDDKAIDKLAADANANLRAFRTEVGINAANDDIALFSAAAAEAFRAFQRSKQRSDLLQAMKEVDQQMPEIAQQGQRAAIIIATALWSEYEERSGDLKEAISLPATSDSDKAKASNELLDASSAHATRIAALESLHNAYGSLPQAHAELIDAVESNAPLDSLQFLLSEVKRIDSLRETLEKAKP
jgi:hypothetical protein